LLQCLVNRVCIFNIQSLIEMYQTSMVPLTKLATIHFIAIPNNNLQFFPTSLLFLDEVISVTLYPDVPL